MKTEQFTEVAKWQKETFPDATALSKVAHLQQEVEELATDLLTKSPDRRLEFADCILLVFGAAASDGMSYEDICSAIDEKMKINKARKWGEPDENGVVNHVK